MYNWRKFAASALAAIALFGATSASSEDRSPPKLIVAISVDQFSADLFAQYRQHYTGGMHRLTEGVVFPSGYQGHAATETCPGHSTIMTGANPARTGIIANDWIDQDAPRKDKTVYCAEDESAPGTDHTDYVESAGHLLVPTLGERIHAVAPTSRNVSVSGKDRAALMMGGKAIDQVYFWKKGQFATLKGRTIDPGVAAINAQLAPVFAAPSNGVEVPAFCRPYERSIPVAGGMEVGTGHFARPGGNDAAFRASPALDDWTIKVAEKLIEEMKLGQREATDVLNVGLSANDYVGHAFGTEGVEMCIQQAALDRNLADLFGFLDSRGIDYVAMLTADHGGHDVPERIDMQAYPDASRIDPTLNAKDIGARVAADLGLPSGSTPLLARATFGDYYVDQSLPADVQARAKTDAINRLRAFPQVAAVFDANELAGDPLPTGPVEEWTLEERARASYYAPRSGDIIVLLKKAVTPIAHPKPDHVATHGSPWDYDRRVPILFWRKGMAPFEQPLSVRTVDIAPTLAALVGLTIPADEIDGRCLDLDAGPGSTCPVRSRD